uniref:Uncharacterized protein n=1 Tax=Meloidogyne incognita TaxID=6306 RepID=A0A914MC29_MELIC
MPRTNSSSSSSQNRRRPNPSSSPGPPARRGRIIESTTPSPGPIIPADQQLIENYLNNQLRLPANTNVTQAIYTNTIPTATTNTTNQRQVTPVIPANTTSTNTINQRQVTQAISVNTNSTTTTTTNTTNQRQMMPGNNINEQQQQQSQMALDVAAEIALKRQQRLNSSQPEAARFINSIDSVSNLTNTDLFMIGWQKDNIFPELVGEVIFTHRGPTPKHGWDRADCHVQIGREGEKETISIFSWKNYADRLQEAIIFNIFKYYLLL